MLVRDVFGIGVAVLVLAGFTVAIVNGKDTANIIGKLGESFGGVVKAATLQG